MFDFFKNKTDNKDLDAKGLRDLLLQFVKEELQRLDGGEGKGIAALQLFVAAGDGDRFLYETALYVNEPGKLQEEIQRIGDNYAIDLPENWKLELLFIADLPAGSIQHQALKTGLMFKSASPVKIKPAIPANAVIRILQGGAEQQEYILDPAAGRINIGREKNVQASDGSYRINAIAFPAENDSNKYISRQHAHLEWDSTAAAFKLYADEGGVPPGNKTKIRSARDESVQKLNSTLIGYPLADGDQVILADTAVLVFEVITT
jgi:hypothetical protein